MKLMDNYRKIVSWNASIQTWTIPHGHDDLPSMASEGLPEATLVGGARKQRHRDQKTPDIRRIRIRPSDFCWFGYFFHIFSVVLRCLPQANLEDNKPTIIPGDFIRDWDAEARKCGLVAGMGWVVERPSILWLVGSGDGANTGGTPWLNHQEWGFNHQKWLFDGKFWWHLTGQKASETIFHAGMNICKWFMGAFSGEKGGAWTDPEPSPWGIIPPGDSHRFAWVSPPSDISRTWSCNKNCVKNWVCFLNSTSSYIPLISIGAGQSPDLVEKHPIKLCEKLVFSSLPY